VKKGYFFILDALIAIVVLISAVSILNTYSLHKQNTDQETYYASDLLDILSSIRVSELTEPDLVVIINKTNESNRNLTVLEYLGRLYLKNEQSAAEEIVATLTDGLFSDKLGFGVWIAGINESKSIYTQELLEGKSLISSKQMITGIEETKPIEGFNSKVFLTGINKQISSSYAYFGGYIGDGNISKNIILPSYDSITTAYVELNAGSDFDLYINNIFSGRYNISSGTLNASNWTISSVYLPNFDSGTNVLTFAFINTSRSYIGGGYVGIHYVASEAETYDPSQKTDYLSGVSGIVNTFDSFYVPGTLTEMSIYLDYDSNYNLYLTIGNATILNSAPTGANTLTLNNTYLSGLLNYNSLNKKTTPFRLGTVSSPDQPGGTSGADIVLITDLSDSMNYSMITEVNGIGRNCTDPQLYNSTTQRISVAKCLDKQFIDAVLANPANKIALAGFYGDSGSPNKGIVTSEDLTNDANSLKQKINAYSPQGGTPICAPLNRAREIFRDQSGAARQKYVIIMSDGIPTHTCASGSGATGDRDGISPKEALWLGASGCAYSGLDDCNNNDCDDGRKNANYSSCQVHKEYNATVYSIGFGPVAACAMANKTLRQVAECGGGEYYASDNATILEELYHNLSETILSLGYIGQRAYALSDISTSFLYPDSYIHFGYTPELPPEEYGRIPVTVESARFNNNITEGDFDVPTGMTVYEAKVTSYSGERWTDAVSIKNSAYNWLNFYNLTSIGNYYYMLGDPYTVNIPVEYIQEGNNSIRIRTGTDPLNSSGGSPQDKVIYTAGVDVSINSTGIFEKAEGCIWFIGFEDGTTTTLPVPSTYNGSQSCTYGASTNCDTDYSTDAINNALCNLFKQLDFDNEGLLYVKLGPTDLNIETSLITNVPYMWGPTLMEVRVWR